MVIFWWVVVGLLTGLAVSRVLRGPGSVSMWDVLAGTVGGIIGGMVTQRIIYAHSYTPHWIAMLVVDFIFGLTAVELVNLLPHTGRRSRVRTEDGRGPVTRTGSTEVRDKAF